MPRPSISGEAASGIGPASAGAARPNGTKTARNGSAEGAGERHLAKPRTPLLAVRGETPRGAAPRLELEEPEELLKAATRTVAAQDAALATAAQAASAAAAAASAADQRVLALATELKSLHDEANTHRATIELMRGRLAQAEDQGRMQSALAALVVALGALLWWLGWRVRALQRERQAAWRQSAAAAQGAAVVAPQAQAAAGSAQVLPAAGVPPPWTAVPDDVAAPPALPSAPLPAVVRVEDTLTRPVSVDELIDLEQQAEFFVVLGDEDAAVDLLMSHLRSTGGTSPLPYLKLLDIYRRRDDRDAYERMRKRFGQRFNAVAPDWEADPEDGRDLLNYPSVLASLQGCWPLPLDAMAELENLLFRKRSGELFELPAYRDVLTLYAVARDLHRRADQPSADVDVLLPLGSSDGFGRAAPPSIFDSLAPRTGDADTPPEYQPTAPVDLDLSEPPAPRDSRVGGLSPLRAGS